MSEDWKTIFSQQAFESAKSDFFSSKLPGSILFFGAEGTGKLSSALSLSRLLSCEKNGAEDCDCASCRASKEIANPSVLICGSRACSLLIKAAQKRLLKYPSEEESKTLFIRAVRILTVRFTPFLWTGSDKLSKFAPLLTEIEDELSSISKDAKKASESIVKSCEKLEEFLYNSMPIDQVRAALEWARIKPSHAKKVLILENAERMQEGSRNALLKILEEPPLDAVFILTTANRGAMMQTILSRVRPYSFSPRSKSVEKDILRAVFREESDLSISEYLNSFLPISHAEIREKAKSYWRTICSGKIPQADALVKECATFSPRSVFFDFLRALFEESCDFSSNSFSSMKSEIAASVSSSVRDAWNAVSVFNQTPVAAIECLTRELFHSIRLSR